MPPIVKVRYQTLNKYSNGHVINLLTKDNLFDFISLPDYIIKKDNKNIISFTRFSDIIRMCLLYEHGGLWLDSTVLLTAPLQPLPQICSRLGFWTPKDDGKIICTCFGAKNWIIREGKWLAFCFYSSKNNVLPKFVKELNFVYINDTFFHKLNWKEDFKEYTETGKLTNYGYIIKNYPPKENKI